MKRFSIVILLALVSAAAVVLVVLTVQSSSSSTCAQEDAGEFAPPPIGDAPEPDEAVMQQIAQILSTALAEERPLTAEEEQQVFLLAKQLTPDRTVTIGGDPPVGGIAELPPPFAVLAAESRAPDC